MIVKVTSYTRIRKAAKATVRCIKHRPNSEGERATRALFGSDGYMEKYHAYDMVDYALRGTVFYRIALSPDPAREDKNRDLDLWGMTQYAMQYVKEHMKKDIQFFAAEHADQSDIRHVNAVVLVRGRLSKEEFRQLPKLLRHAAWEDVKRQRDDLDPQPSYQHFNDRARIEVNDPYVPQKRGGFARPFMDVPCCPNCGDRQPMWQIDDGLYMCPDCGTQYTLTHSQGLEREGAQLSL